MANNFKNAFATSVSTNSGSPTDVYTSNNGSACNSILIELDVANTGTSAVQVTVLVRDSSANAAFPVGSALKVVSGQKVVLNGDDKIQVYASAATVDVVASILQDVT
jgi:hypothetical protein